MSKDEICEKVKEILANYYDLDSNIVNMDINIEDTYYPSSATTQYVNKVLGAFPWVDDIEFRNMTWDDLKTGKKVCDYVFEEQ